MSTICCCGSTNCVGLDFITTLCGARINGAILSATDGSTTRTGVTSGTAPNNGRGGFFLPNTGTWARSVTAPAGSHYSFPAVADLNVTTCNGAVFQTISAGSPDTGWTCIPDSCCFGQQGGGPIYKVVNWPTTIFVNDGFGVVTCTGGGPGPTSPGWVGCATRTAAQAMDCTGNGGLGAIANGVSVPVFFVVGCGTISVNFNSCNRTAGGGCWPGPYTSGQPSSNFLPAVDTNSCAPDVTCGKLVPSNGTYNGASFVVSGPVTVGGCVTGSGTMSFSGSATLGSTPRPFPGAAFDATYAAYQIYGSSVSLSAST